MKPTKQQIEKMQKGKEESKPREVFKIKGWIVTCDKYNWTTHKGKLTYYFSTLENALYYIQMMEERKVEGEVPRRPPAPATRSATAFRCSTLT